MDTGDLYKELYFYEMERRDRLNSGLSFPVGLVVLLTGAAFVMFKAADAAASDWDKALIVLLAIVASTLMLASVFLIRMYWGHGFWHMPFADDLANYADNLYAHYLKQGVNPTNSRKFAKAKILAYVEREFSRNAKFNAQVNDRKSKFLFLANAFIISAIVFLGLSSPLYIYTQTRHKVEVHKIEITNRSLAVTQQQEQNPQPQPQPAREPEPQPPPSRLIKEHTEKPSSK